MIASKETRSRRRSRISIRERQMPCRSNLTPSKPRTPSLARMQERWLMLKQSKTQDRMQSATRSRRKLISLTMMISKRFHRLKKVLEKRHQPRSNRTNMKMMSLRPMRLMRMTALLYRWSKRKRKLRLQRSSLKSDRLRRSRWASQRRSLLTYLRERVSTRSLLILRVRTCKRRRPRMFISMSKIRTLSGWRIKVITSSEDSTTTLLWMPTPRLWRRIQSSSADVSTVLLFSSRCDPL